MTQFSKKEIFPSFAYGKVRDVFFRWSAALLLAGFLAGTVLSPLFMAARKPVHAAALAQSPAPLSVVINEIAWAGTAASSADEWIELYNPGTVDIDLTGWRLAAEDGSPDIALSGTIPAGGYFLLERTDDNTVADVPADQLYTGALSNSGETLQLLASDGTVIDTANQSGGAWPAGNSSAPASMERVGSIPDGPTAWVTNNGLTVNGLAADGTPIRGTPRQPNSTDYSSLSVTINEVAWAGTLASSDDEWIELYNPGTVDIDLTGWRLVAEDGSPDVILGGSIPANGYFLLERAYDNVVADVLADQIYLGALDDGGEILRLRAPNGSVVDTANLDGGGWPAGSLSPNGSIERMGVVADSSSAWVTNTGTVSNGRDAAGSPIHGSPGQSNWGITVTHTPTPTLVPSLAVLINEVAWAGTSASSSDEWIELHNHGSVPVDLTGWRLVADDGSPDIDLSGSIPAGGYYLLERTDDNTVSDIPADLIFSGSLSNDGEVFRLLAPDGSTVDTANLDGGAWPAGSRSPDCGSMERNGVVDDGPLAWTTNTGAVANGLDADGDPLRGTPKQPNWAVSVTSTPSPAATKTPVPAPTQTRTPTPLPYQPVVLNEFLPRAGHDWNGDGSVDVYDEFVEIVNRSEQPVDLQGWKLDDEHNSGSDPYTLPSVTLEPGQRIAIFGAVSHISLGDGGDTVRLLKSNGQVADAFTYPLVEKADQAWCRLPDGKGFWDTECFPTPDDANALSGALPAAVRFNDASACLLPDTIPVEILRVECGPLGLGIWNAGFWDGLAGETPVVWLAERSKWATWFR